MQSPADGSTIGSGMRAVYYESIGPATQVLRFGQLPDPTPGPGEVRVRLRWSGVNPNDVKSRSVARGTGMPFPHVVPHSDGMGLIAVSIA